MCWTWASAVRGAITSRAAISRLDRPSATNWAICRSRRVSGTGRSWRGEEEAGCFSSNA